MSTKFSILLKTLRNQKEYSQRQLGLLADVSHATISRLENGVSEPYLDTLKKLAPHLNIEYEELMKAVGYICSKKKQQKVISEKETRINANDLIEEGMELVIERYTNQDNKPQ